MERLRPFPLQHTFLEKYMAPNPQSGDALLSALKQEDESILYFCTLSESKGSILQKLPERAIKAFVSQIIIEEIQNLLNY